MLRRAHPQQEAVPAPCPGQWLCVSPDGTRGPRAGWPCPACPPARPQRSWLRRQRCVIGCNSMYLATQMSHAASCPKGRRTRTVNKDLGVLHFGVPAASLTLFTLNYSGSALSNYIWSTPATSRSCSTTTLMTTSIIQRERVKTHL